MSDRDEERRQEEEGRDEEQDTDRPRRSYHEERRTIDYSSPLWRLLGVVSFFGGLTALGFYLEEIGLGRQFSTVATIAAVFTVGYWADKRPDRLERRAGPFWRIATAIRESREDLRVYTYARPIRVAFIMSIGYGVAIVLLQSALLALLRSLYDWKLAVFAGALIGAFVIAPSFFKDIWSRLSEGPADFADYHRQRETRDENEAEDEAEHEYASARDRDEDED